MFDRLPSWLKVTIIGLVLLVIEILVVFSYLDIKIPFFDKVPFLSAAVCKDCNIILVSLDTLAAEHLPCYGYDKNTAPNLCQFAAENIIFPNSYSQTSSTLPSHMSIFTSLYPGTHRVIKTFTDSLDEKYLTLAQALRLNNYQTTYYGPLTDLHMPLDKGIGRGFNVVKASDGNLNNWQEALEKLKDNTQKQQPAFLFLHTYFVHHPYLTGHSNSHKFTNLPEYPNIPLTNEEYRNVTSEFSKYAVSYYMKNTVRQTGSTGIDVGSSTLAIIDQIAKTSDYNKSLQLFRDLPVPTQNSLYQRWYEAQINPKDIQQVEYMKALYDERIYQLDQKLAYLLSFMSDPQISKKTILIITADHGEEFMEHGFLFHGFNIYKPTTHVPLIMHVPGIKKKTVKGLAQGIDIYPTVLGLVGVKPQPYLEGLDLSGQLYGNVNAPRNEFVISDYTGWRAIMNDKWRLYQRASNSGTVELYDMVTDPKEQRNIAASNREIVENLNSSLQKILHTE